MRKFLSVLLILLLALSPAAGTAETEEVWMYVLSVGKADAILLGVGDWVCLIDAGYGRSMGKILSAMEQMGVDHLDAVFVTHTDTDHTEGLTWLSESDIEIGTWYASAMYTGVKEKKHPAVQAAGERDQEVVWLQAGDIIDLGTAQLAVLAPSELNEDKDNNNSLVMMLESDAGSILLCGDMEYEEEAILLASGADLSCDVLKVANHADDDTGSEAFLLTASPQIAVISTDSAEKSDTPDAQLLALLEIAGAGTYVTEDCTGGILVTLNSGSVTVEMVDLPEPTDAVSIAEMDADEDLITIVNSGTEDVDLSGWYLYSSRGGEMYIFSDGTALSAGGTLILGSKSTDDDIDTDLTWKEKKVIHRSKSDTITLYDSNGMAVSSMDNGY